MKALLWDGQKQIRGELILEKTQLKFKLADFSETDLDFDLSYTEIEELKYYKLYNLKNQGLEITSVKGKKNVFIVEDPGIVKKAIERKCLK